jgi:hypothetical protein
MQYALRPLDTVTLVALGKSSYDWVRHTHKDFLEAPGEVWTINAGCAVFRHDVCWDTHTKEWLEERKDKLAHVLRRREWMKTHDKPIVMARRDPEIPTSLTYPLRAVIEATHSYYFSGGMSYPLAYAHACKVKRFRLFGADFSYDRDRNTHDEQGRACAEYWIGRMVEAGVRVEYPLSTHFMDMHRRSGGHIYGYHEPVEVELPDGGGSGRFIGPDYVD